MWLVKRRQRRQLFQLVEDRIVEQHGRRELLAAMHDSMADRRDAQVIRVSGDPLVKHRKHAFMVAGTNTPTGERLVDHAPALRIGHDESRIGSNAVNRAAIARGEIQPTRLHGEHRELDARRSRVEDEDDVRHHATMRALHDGEPCEQAVGVVVAADREQLVEPAVAHVAAGERLEPDLAHDRPDQIPIEVRPAVGPSLPPHRPNVDIRRDADQAEDARIEAELLFENAGTVHEQRLLDGDARQAPATREPEALHELRRRRCLTVCGIGEVLDEHVLGDEARQIPCAARVHERVDHEHLHPVPKTREIRTAAAPERRRCVRARPTTASMRTGEARRVPSGVPGDATSGPGAVPGRASRWNRRLAEVPDAARPLSERLERSRRARRPMRSASPR